MATPLPTDLEKQILQRMEAGDSRNVIILSVCESLALDWREAEAIVDRLHGEHAADITLGQSPLLVLLALGTFLAGVGLLLYAVYSAVSMYHFIYGGRNEMLEPGPFGWKVAHDFLIYLIASGEQYVGMLALAVAMLVGSLRGMSEVWAAIFEKLGTLQDRS